MVSNFRPYIIFPGYNPIIPGYNPTKAESSSHRKNRLSGMFYCLRKAFIEGPNGFHSCFHRIIKLSFVHSFI